MGLGGQWLITGPTQQQHTKFFKNFWECVDALDEHGFVTDYAMLDGASTNRAFMNMLLPDGCRASKYTTRDIFDLDHQSRTVSM